MAKSLCFPLGNLDHEGYKVRLGHIRLAMRVAMTSRDLVHIIKKKIGPILNLEVRKQSGSRLSRRSLCSSLKESFPLEGEKEEC